MVSIKIMTNQAGFEAVNPTNRKTVMRKLQEIAAEHLGVKPKDVEIFWTPFTDAVGAAGLTVEVFVIEERSATKSQLEGFGIYTTYWVDNAEETRSFPSYRVRIIPIPDALTFATIKR